ncbi:MAG TPA: hypothetical protein VHA37_09470 [Candidatus Saccharimonadales bacterium]|nr:hypothetical protein [Candidatus Saccharimonadales bacterium]
MAGDVMVDTVNIDVMHVHIALGADINAAEELGRLIGSELERAGDGETMSDIYGQDMPDMDVVRDADMPPTAEEAAELEQARAEELTQEMVDLETRSDDLHLVVYHLDRMNNKRGQLTTNDAERQPDDDERKELEITRSAHRRKASLALSKACEVCPLELSADCPLKDNLSAWHDAHYYKNRNGRRGPGSLRDGSHPPEARRPFLERLRAYPKLHCEPSLRKTAPAEEAQTSLPVPTTAADE